MNRWIALILLFMIGIGLWALFSFTSVPQLLTDPESPVIFTLNGYAVSQSVLLWVCLIFPAWIGMIILGSAIDPILGWYIYRIGLYLIMVYIFQQKDFKIGEPSRGGHGSGKGTRVG